MNLLTGRIVRTTALSVRCRRRRSCRCRSDHAARRRVPGGDHVGIRPEHFDARPPGCGPPIEVTPDVVEPLGTDTLVFFNPGGHEGWRALAAASSAPAGDRCGSSSTLARMHLFDGGRPGACAAESAASQARAAACPRMTFATA